MQLHAITRIVHAKLNLISTNYQQIKLNYALWITVAVYQDHPFAIALGPDSHPVIFKYCGNPGYQSHSRGSPMQPYQSFNKAGRRQTKS